MLIFEQTKTFEISGDPHAPPAPATLPLHSPLMENEDLFFKYGMGQLMCKYCELRTPPPLSSNQAHTSNSTISLDKKLKLSLPKSDGLFLLAAIPATNVVIVCRMVTLNTVAVFAI